jgi:diguanylate cyclase (GGDEF)-like protein
MTHMSNESRTRITSVLNTPGISRKLTLGFFAVILVVGGTLPLTLMSFQKIDAASDQAQDSSRTLRNVAVFQRRIGDVRASARDLSARDNAVVRGKLTTTLQEALDAARCIGEPAKCDAPLLAGEQLPTDEAARWQAIAASAAAAKTTFETTMSSDRRAAVNALDAELAREVDVPSQELAEQIASRGIDAQSEITRTIASSVGLLVGAMVASIMLAALLATIIPRRLMKRLEHLRHVSHRLAHGDLEARADEHLARRNDEIGDLIADFNLMAMAMQRQTLDLRTAQEQLHIALQQEQERATRDPLTGLRNHRYFQDCLSAEIERCRRSGGHVTIAVLDLDNFKQVNDRFGHSEGDAVLRRATKGISDNLRPYDLACRLGGEEFGIIFPEASAEEAIVVLDRIAQHILPFGPNGERLSFSGGVTTWPLHAETQTELYQRADEASYTAKMQGKACSLVYDPTKVSQMGSEERTMSRERDAMLTTATTLVSAVDQKDPYTRHHSELVAIYAATIARSMRLDEPTVKLVYRAGLLHDVGKIGIADEILVKGSQLTHDEWVQLRMHPEFSYRILEAAAMEPVATWTRHHHEHYDGSGYPFGLAGEDIPIGSRIILVADAFESMTSDRVYRRALGQRQAIEELVAGAGRQFDPQVVEAMVALVEQGVFVQVMQQHGRVIEVEPIDERGEIVELDPASRDAAVASAALDGVPPSPHATSEAEQWALDQITDEHWAQPPAVHQPIQQEQAQAQEQVQQPAQAMQPAEQAPQWTQQQWDEYQRQAALEQAAFDAAQLQQAQLSAEAAQAQVEAHADAVPEHPAFDPSQWAPPSPEDLAA